MEHPISEGGVDNVAVYHHDGPSLHAVQVYIHHQLTPQREEELATLIEGLVVRAITTWAKL